VKRKYWSELDAKIALAQAGGKDRRGKGNRNELDYYRCPDCAGRPWHLRSSRRR
jgi:hypothetical protein